MSSWPRPQHPVHQQILSTRPPSCTWSQPLAPAAPREVQAPIPDWPTPHSIPFLPPYNLCPTRRPDLLPGRTAWLPPPSGLPGPSHSASSLAFQANSTAGPLHVLFAPPGTRHVQVFRQDPSATALGLGPDASVVFLVHLTAPCPRRALLSSVPCFISLHSDHCCCAAGWLSEDVPWGGGLGCVALKWEGTEGGQPLTRSRALTCGLRVSVPSPSAQ